MTEVGPVLLKGAFADAVVSVLRSSGRSVHITDRGSYLRVAMDLRCELSTRALAEELGHDVALRPELERLMPSFAGRLSFTAEGAVWEVPS